MSQLISFHLLFAVRRFFRVFKPDSVKTTALLLLTGSALNLLISACAPTNSANSTVKLASNQNTNFSEKPSSIPQKQTVVRIGYIKTSLSAMVKARGTLERELALKNVQIKWVGPFPSFAPVLETINAKSSDLGAGGDIAGLSALSSGINACIVAYRPANTRSEAILVHADSPLHTFKDLIGKKVIVNQGGISEHLLLTLMEKENIPKNKINRVYLKPDDALPAWVERHVDAWTVWDPWVSIAEVKYNARQIPLPGTVPHYSLYMVHREALAEKPEAIKEVLAILAREAEWMNQHPKEAQKLYQKVVGSPPEVVKRTFDRRPLDGVLPLDSKVIADLQKAADWIYKQGEVQKKVEVRDKLCPGAEVKQ